jgi:hypothetical protein
MTFIPGNKTSDLDTDAKLVDLRKGLDFLKPRNDGIGLLKRLGMSKQLATAVKHEWNETALAIRAEASAGILIGDTDIVVVDAYVYQINDLIRIANEVVRVTALKSATEITVTRAYAGTAAAAHAAGVMLVLLGSAAPENADAPAGRSDAATRLYNYVQTFDGAIDLSDDEIMSANNERNPKTGQIKRRTIEWYQKFAQAMFYGIRFIDATLNIRVMGGLKYFITTNATNAAGALTIALIDAEIKQIVDAGGDPKLMAMGTKQKQKLDALDTAKQMLGKREHTGGNLMTQTWQSGILDHTIDILVDPSILDDELWILDTDYIAIGYFAGNGKSGALKVTDASTPGKDGEKRVIRGKYTMEVRNEKAHSYLYGLT